MKKLHIVLLVSLLGASLILIQFTLLTKGRASASQITLHAAGRGNPWINLLDGRDLPTDYMTARGVEPTLDQARPVSLTSGDFDRDGTADLISGYAGPDGGTLALHRGNVDALYPNSPGAEQRKAEGTFTDAPFFASAGVFVVPVAPELLGAGDFNADGNLDVVAAAVGGGALCWMAGDGRGGFHPARILALPGEVTAMATGEINRADGLIDVVVAINGPGGPQALVFESPEGALEGWPEVYGLPAEATALALGQLDEEYPYDLAVAGGAELLVVHGRDRMLSLDEIRQAEVQPAHVDRQSLPFSITAIQIGDFAEDYRSEIALLSSDGAIHLLEREGKGGQWGNLIAEIRVSNQSIAANASGSLGPRVSASLLVRARVSGRPGDDLIVVDQASRQLQIVNQGSEVRGQWSEQGVASPQMVSLDVEGEPVAVLPMRLNADALSDLVVLKQGGQSALTVAPTAPAATFTVNLTSNQSDANLSDNVCDIDLVTGGLQCTLRAAVEQANASAGADSIVFEVGAIPNATIPGITGPVTIDGTSMGRVELTNSGLGITAGSSTVRALTLNDGVGLSLNTNGGNIVENCIFRGCCGVTVFRSSDNTIGGATAEARNMFVDRASARIFGSSGGADATGNRIRGNYIGTDGTNALGNDANCAVEIGSANNNTVGGTEAGARNVISGGRRTNVGTDGICIEGFSAQGGNLVQGNFIGTNASGTGALGNDGFGIHIGMRNNTVGGTTTAARNIISANTASGIQILSNSAVGN